MTIRVLVVDDSAMVRRVVVQALTGLDGITVVGTAVDGQDALTQVAALAPDLVTLDIEMPVMDGIETMRALRRAHPRLPVIMFSTLTERGARATFDALAAGARDYVTKPTNSSGLAESITTIRHELGSRIRALCTPLPPMPAPALPSPSAPVRVTRGTVERPARRLTALTIGSSTGGPDALATVLNALPSTLPVPVLIVQHMPPVFTTLLADRLNRTAQIEVRESVHGEPVRAGVAYIAPGNHHLAVTGTPAAATLTLSQGPQENYCRPAVDVLFRSVAGVYGAGALAVILTGMGSDGTAGAGVLKAAGASVYVQDQASSVVWGMPGAATAAGHADRVLPLSQVADAIVGRLRTGSAS